jgi:hypothetical protein
MNLWHTEYTEDAEKHGFFIYIRRGVVLCIAR